MSGPTDTPVRARVNGVAEASLGLKVTRADGTEEVIVDDDVPAAPDPRRLVKDAALAWVELGQHWLGRIATRLRR